MGYDEGGTVGSLEGILDGITDGGAEGNKEGIMKAQKSDLLMEPWREKKGRRKD